MNAIEKKDLEGALYYTFELLELCVEIDDLKLFTSMVMFLGNISMDC